MERGKKLMEKWGWTSGQGLGKDSRGMTSFLALKKTDGSANQGRIERVDTMFKQEKAKANPDTDPALLQAFYASVGLVAPSTGDEPASKRLKLKTDDNTGGLAPIEDPDSLIAKYGAPKSDAPAPVVSEWKPREKKKYNTGWKWPKQYDNWRWSKGTEALRFFEEMQLPKNLQDLAKTVLGETSRFPARLADDTDCVVQLTAWGTIILRPRGTGANMSLAKRMLFQMMHPSQEILRDEIMFEQDDAEDAKINDQTGLLEGLEGDRADRLREIMDRKKLAGKRNVGLGADVQAAAEAEDQSKLEKREMELSTTEDIVLVQSKLGDLRIATGASAMIKNGSLVLVGKEKSLDRAELLVKTLIETGEWVALLEAFVVSEETKKQRRGDDGPVEQILIKVPEGIATQLIGRHLKAIERAAEAEQLKLSSKPISGKRTLMVEGIRKAHERVKLMAKELAEKGESPMLNKYLASALARQGDAADAETKKSKETAPGVIVAPPSLKVDTDVKTEIKQEIKTEIKVEVKTEVKEEQTEDDEVTTIQEGAAPPATSVPSRAVPAMRTLPAPKLNRDVLVDLEAPQIITEEETPSEVFPPMPPSVAPNVSALPMGPPPAFPPIPPGFTQTSPPVEAMDDQQKELQDFIDGVTE